MECDVTRCARLDKPVTNEEAWLQENMAANACVWCSVGWKQAVFALS